MTTATDDSIALTVQTDISKGSLMIQDAFTQISQRHGLINADFLNILSDIFLSETDNSDVAWYETGKIWGQEYYIFISAFISANPQSNLTKPQDCLKDDLIENLNANFSYMGAGQFRLIEGNKYYVIELKNPFLLHPQLNCRDNLIVMLAGFFSVLMSRFAEKSLDCIPFNPEEDADTLRFAISTEKVIAELLNLITAKKSFRDIAEIYHNQHLL